MKRRVTSPRVSVSAGPSATAFPGPSSASINATRHANDRIPCLPMMMPIFGAPDKASRPERRGELTQAHSMATHLWARSRLAHRVEYGVNHDLRAIALDEMAASFYHH